MTAWAWDVLAGRPALEHRMLAELSRLRAALPGYEVIITRHGPARRFEAIRRTDGPGPWCVISTDPANLWRELAPWARPDANTGGPARAP